eukprot:TRINITY_DN29634_c1_g1_i1.p1 TRINITY_DN29634_c1_g1~~TRINITY_DN29634_c1_g1_i1.p1  ORF type:complete len:145 (-),score=21.82 TRINITY_DN29634_c1_g1_i1:178-588(-)
MSGQDSSSSSSGDYARFAGNTRIRELGCYVDLNGSFYEVPRLDVEQNLRWELVAQSVDVIYPHGVRGSNRMVVDVMSYKQRRGDHQILHHTGPGLHWQLVHGGRDQGQNSSDQGWCGVGAGHLSIEEGLSWQGMCY